MATSFSLDGISGESRSALAPWQIHDVIFKGCEYKSGQVKTDPSKTWEMFTWRFEDDKGNYYTDSKFFDEATGTTRREIDTRDGGKKKLPSDYEVFQIMFAQFVNNINPDALKTLQSKTYSSFKDICEAVVKVLNAKIGTRTKLKLVAKTDKEGKVKATLPKFVEINKNSGSAFASNNFIGEKLFFSPYEETARKDFLAKANPTPVATVAGTNNNSGQLVSAPAADQAALLGALGI